MIIAVTGHRPDKLGGYHLYTPKRLWVRHHLRDQLTTRQPEYCISGMALGVDQDFASVCIELGIPFIAAVPFEGQESVWSQASKRVYHELLAKARSVEVISTGGYSAEKMMIRNAWMVDHCDLLLAVWDGTPGGTCNCVSYATQQQRSFVRLNPNLMTVTEHTNSP